MHLYNAWLPPPVAEETKREKESFAQVVRTVKELYRPDDPDSVYSTIKWVSVIDMFIKAKSEVSLEDVAALVELGLELFLTSHNKLYAQVRWGSILVKLLNKYRKKLSLKVQWRPFYDTLVNTHFSGNTGSEGWRLRQRHFEAVTSLVQCCRRFFPPGSASEIWSEFGSLLENPCHNSCFEGAGFVRLFLPTNMDNLDFFSHDWIKICLDQWNSIPNCQYWNSQWATVTARVIKNYKFISWDNFLPVLFTRYLNMFEVPVANGNESDPFSVDVPRNTRFLFSNKAVTPAKAIAKSIVHLLKPGSSAQQHFEKLFNLLEQYYHPSNGGRCTYSLERFLLYLAITFQKRLQHEQQNEDNSRKAELCLGPSERAFFVNTVLKLIDRGQYRKNEHLSETVAAATSILSYVEPSLVLPFLASRFHMALETKVAEASAAAPGVFLVKPLMEDQNLEETWVWAQEDSYLYGCQVHTKRERREESSQLEIFFSDKDLQGEQPHKGYLDSFKKFGFTEDLRPPPLNKREARSNEQKMAEASAAALGVFHVKPLMEDQNLEETRVQAQVDLYLETKRKRRVESSQLEISFSDKDLKGEPPHKGPPVITLKVGNCLVDKIMVHTGSSIDVMYFDALKKFGFTEDLRPPPLNEREARSNGQVVQPKGVVTFPVHAGSKTVDTQFLVIDAPSTYNVILGRSWIHEMKAVASTYHRLLCGHGKRQRCKGNTQLKISSSKGVLSQLLKISLWDEAIVSIPRVLVVKPGRKPVFVLGKYQAQGKRQRCGESSQLERSSLDNDLKICFSDEDLQGEPPREGHLVITLKLGNRLVDNILVDTGAVSCNLMYLHSFKLFGSEVELITLPLDEGVAGFNAQVEHPKGVVTLPVHAGSKTVYTRFLVIDAPSSYNAILGTSWIHEMKAVASTYHGLLKFPNLDGTTIEEIRGD